MPLLNTSRAYWGRGFIYVLLLFLLLWEWLRPIATTTDTLRTDIFVLSIGFMLLINYLALHKAANVVIKIGFVFALIFFMYFKADYAFFSTLWLSDMWMEIRMNIAFVLDGRWDITTQVARTFSFLLLIWFFTSTVYRLVIERQRVLTMLLLTEVFLTALETFTPYDAKWAIVRTLVFGLVLLAFMNLSVVETVTKVSSRRATWPGSWIAATLVLVILVSGVGFVSPKSEAAWPDPVSWVTNIGKGKVIQKIGYGEDDSYLGGPFMMDDQLIFTAQTPQVHYWRGEAKNFYDGKGWTSTVGGSAEVTMQEVMPGNLYDPSLETTEGTQRLNFDNFRYPVLFHSGQVVQVNAASPSLNGITVREGNSKIAPVDDKKMNGYELQVDLPVFYKEDLLASPQQYSEEIVTAYTQLPPNFPKRITALAMEVTEGKETPWEKAQAVESFLRFGKFSYETTDVAVPKRNEDYVDQFLFETMKGYCDNFSSSMVTMLRSIGIPARWVKGFNSGDYTLNTSTGIYDVQVRSLNAHSWPEVYFEGIGWVPFEPTPGFTSPITLEEREEVDQEIAIPANQSDRRFERDMEELLEDEFSTETTGGKGNQPLLSKWAVIAIVAALIVASAVLLYLFRFSIWIWLLERAKRKGKEESTLFTLFDRILQLFERKGGERLPHQTMREYVLSVERFKPSQSGQMREFTKLFEGIRYGRFEKGDFDKVWDRARFIWKEVATRFRS